MSVRAVRPSRLVVAGVLIAFCLRAPISATSLYPIQLQSISEVSVDIRTDGRNDPSRSVIQSRVEAKLKAARILIKTVADPKVELSISSELGPPGSGVTALLVQLRVLGRVSLRRMPEVDLTNHPAVIWERQTFDVIPQDAVGSTVAKQVDDLMESLLDERASVERMLDAERKAEGSRK